MSLVGSKVQACVSAADHGPHTWIGPDSQAWVCYGHFRGWDLPHPEVLKGDPSTCSHGVLDEVSGAPWGFEDCVTCGKRFPMRRDAEDSDEEPGEPDDY